MARQLCSIWPLAMMLSSPDQLPQCMTNGVSVPWIARPGASHAQPGGFVHVFQRAIQVFPQALPFRQILQHCTFRIWPFSPIALNGQFAEVTATEN